MRKKDTHISTMTRAAVISALGVALLSIAYLVEVLDLTMAAFAAILVWIMYLEYGLPAATSVYLVTSVLSFLLMPLNTGCVCYAFLFGWFPLLKGLLDKKMKNKHLRSFVRNVTFTGAFAICIAFFFQIFVGDLDFAALAKEFSFLPLENSEHIAAFLDAPFLCFHFNNLQAIMIGLYLILAPLMAMLFNLLLNKFTLFYAFKIRPTLVKAGIFKNKK